MNTDMWVVQWGLLKLTIKQYDIVETEVKKYTYLRTSEIDKKENIPIDISEILKLLEDRDEIINVNTECDNSKIFYSSSLDDSNDENRNMDILLIKPINLKISAEEILKREFIDIFKDAKYLSDFNVFYDGYFYFVYWKQNRNSPIFMQGAHIRNILKETFASSSKYETEPVPPTPFGRELCFDFFNDDNIGEYEIKSQKKEKLYEIISVNLPKSKNEHDFFSKLNSLIENDFRGYFGLLEEKNEIRSRVREIYEKISFQTELCNQFQGTGTHHILRHRDLKNQMKQNMTELFRDYSQYFLRYSSYQRKKEEIVKEFPNNRYLSSRHNEYIKELETESCNFELISSLINYSKDVLTVSEGNHIQLIGIVIGGIITLISVYIGSLL